jgi:hypothetical protein
MHCDAPISTIESMSHTIPIEEAAGKLKELVRDLAPGDEIVLTDADKPIARLKPEPKGEMASLGRVMPGAGIGMIEIVGDIEDNSDLLDMFKEYLP